MKRGLETYKSGLSLLSYVFIFCVCFMAILYVVADTYVFTQKCNELGGVVLTKNSDTFCVSEDGRILK